jgi:GH43 family beta-xylosidase
MKWLARQIRLLAATVLAGFAIFTNSALHGACLTNSIMSGQDPAVTLKDGLYHLVQSDGCRVHLRRSATIGGLATAADSVIWSPGCSEVWAPELHWLSNRWYLYWSLNPGGGHRGYVAESQGTSPFGPYTSRGTLFPSFWNIDGSVFTTPDGKLYYICSGNQGSTQNLYIAPMSNPYTLSGPLVLLSEPTQPWERIGDPKVNEGPWAFQREGQLFIVYSASGCWTDDYALGLLTFSGTNILERASWTKSGPAFTKQPGAYGPGHGSVLQDASGQWWNIYHANNNSGEGCGGFRKIRAQRLAWTVGNWPDFGTPLPIGSVVNEDVDFLVARFALDQMSGATAVGGVCGRSATLRGSPVWVSPGLKFGGTNDYLDCGAAIGNDVQHSVTLAAWIRAEAFTDWAGLISKGSNTAPYAMQVWGDGSLRFTANWGGPAGGKGGGSWNSITKMSTGQWCHAAVTYDGASVRFYLNGILDMNQPGVALRFGVVNEPLFLGVDFPGGDEYFRGTLRDARVYGRALSEIEIMALANRPPALSPVPDFVVGAGQTLAITNSAVDLDSDQSLTFMLLSAPAGAWLNSTNGVFSWRPEVTQAVTTNLVTFTVADDGSPSLTATQRFTITVTNLTKPGLSSPMIDQGRLFFRVDGDYGPGYTIQSTTNLSQGVQWLTLFRTNPPSLPFIWADSTALDTSARFYRVICE